MSALPAPGLHRPGGTAEEVVGAYRDAGWAVARVTAAGSTAELYAALAGALALPPWFGANLDALWDCLADLPGPTVLVLTGWQRYAAAELSTWERLVELLRERAELAPPFAVLLV